MTQLISGISTPRPITSVHTRMPLNSKHTQHAWNKCYHWKLYKFLQYFQIIIKSTHSDGLDLVYFCKKKFHTFVTARHIMHNLAHCRLQCKKLPADVFLTLWSTYVNCQVTPKNVQEMLQNDDSLEYLWHIFLTVNHSSFSVDQLKSCAQFPVNGISIWLHLGLNLLKEPTVRPTESGTATGREV